MDSTNGTCMRCGKDLITVKVTKELVGNSMVITTESKCSDVVCESKFEIQREKDREFINQFPKVNPRNTKAK